MPCCFAVAMPRPDQTCRLALLHPPKVFILYPNSPLYTICKYQNPSCRVPVPTAHKRTRGGGGGGERQDKSSERCLSVASSPFGPFAERALPRCHRLIQAHHGRVGTQTHMLLHFAEDKGRKKRSDFHHLVRHLCASMSLCERHNLEHDVTMRGRVQASMQASMHMHVQASMQSCKHPCTCTS